MEEFRKMRRFKQELPAEICEDVLRTEPRGVLAVNGEQGYPYTVPMDFLYAEGKIWFHCALEGAKMDAIRKDPKCCFNVLRNLEQDEEGFWYVQSVVVFGRISLVTEEATKLRMLRELGRKYFPTEAFVEKEMRSSSRAAVLTLSVDHMTGKRVHEQ